MISIDFFGSPLRKQVEQTLNSLQASKTKSVAPGDIGLLVSLFRRLSESIRKFPSSIGRQAPFSNIDPTVPPPSA